MAADGTPQVKKNEIIIQVKGIVCSFCSRGAEKNVSKLLNVDKSKYGKDGVLVNIKTHRITMAIMDGKEADLKDVYKSIKDGGYDPVSIYMRLEGLVTKAEGTYYIEVKDKKYKLSGKLDKITADTNMILQVTLDGKEIAKIKDGIVIPVTVTAVELKK